MSEYTPTTDEARNAFVQTSVWFPGVYGLAEKERIFDRWLAAHDAEVRAEALDTEAYPMELLEFRSAWEAADEVGAVGFRVRHGLAAMLTERARRLNALKEES